MKKIYFDDLRNKKTTRRIILSSIVIFQLSIFTLFTPYVMSSVYIGLFCLVPMVSTLGRMLILPRYISWTKNYINVKLGSSLSKKIMFNEVLEVTQSNQKVVFWKELDEQIEIDFSDYKQEDFIQFLNIISEKLRSKAHFAETPTWMESSN